MDSFHGRFFHRGGRNVRGVASLNGADTAEKKLTIAMEFGLGVAAARMQRMQQWYRTVECILRYPR